ncbi:MAG: SigE family RNA polymerase sigma factor [Kineosporiaceae bacterium]
MPPSVTVERPTATLRTHGSRSAPRVVGDVAPPEVRLTAMQPPRRREPARDRSRDEPAPAPSDVPVGTAGSDRGYADFVQRHAHDLGRLAYLMTGDGDGAEDLLADALLAAWQRWDTVLAADSPLAYVRGIVVKLAATRVRRLVRERAHLVLLRSDARSVAAAERDVPGVVDVRAALRRLPAGQRACVVLRHGMGLSEEDTARTLGVSVGTVKSQTSKAAARLRRLLAVDDLGQWAPGEGPDGRARGEGGRR